MSDDIDGLIFGDIRKIIMSLPKYVKLSGSRALGTENEDSDYDFYVPEEKWEEFKEWASQNISKNFISCITGQIAYYVNGLEHKNLIEFSYLFPKIKKKL